RLRVDQLLELAALFEPADRHVGGQAQFGQREVGAGRVLAEVERVVGLAEEARVLAGRDRAVADDVGVGDRGRHVAAGRGEGADLEGAAAGDRAVEEAVAGVGWVAFGHVLILRGDLKCHPEVLRRIWPEVRAVYFAARSFAALRMTACAPLRVSAGTRTPSS